MKYSFRFLFFFLKILRAKFDIKKETKTLFYDRSSKVSFNPLSFIFAYYICILLTYYVFIINFIFISF